MHEDDRQTSDTQMNSLSIASIVVMPASNLAGVKPSLTISQKHVSPNFVASLCTAPAGREPPGDAIRSCTSAMLVRLYLFSAMTYRNNPPQVTRAHWFSDCVRAGRIVARDKNTLTHTKSHCSTPYNAPADMAACFVPFIGSCRSMSSCGTILNQTHVANQVSAVTLAISNSAIPACQTTLKLTLCVRALHGS